MPPWGRPPFSTTACPVSGPAAYLVLCRDCPAASPTVRDSAKCPLHFGCLVAVAFSCWFLFYAKESYKGRLKSGKQIQFFLIFYIHDFLVFCVIAIKNYGSFGLSVGYINMGKENMRPYQNAIET